MKVLQKNGEMKEVKHLYPDTKCAVGPAITNGFYYDFDFGFSFSEEYLQAVEEAKLRD